MERSATPLGELIVSVGRCVAEAQQTIDGRVLEHFSAIYDHDVAAFEVLRSIHYQPTWYQISEASGEIVLALTMTRLPADATGSTPRPRQAHGAHVDASYQSRFTYEHRAASSLKFRVVPVPPPAAASLTVGANP